MVHFWQRRSTPLCCEMPANRAANANLMKSLTSLATPGMYLYNKFNEYKRQQEEQNKRKVTEKELENLNNKITTSNLDRQTVMKFDNIVNMNGSPKGEGKLVEKGKLLAKLDERDKRDDPNGNDEECVICMGAKATMQTFPCSHKVVCRKCFIKTIQVAVSQRSLPLRCVICRARILKLRQAALPKVAVTTPTNPVARTMPKSPSLFQCVK